MIKKSAISLKSLTESQEEQQYYLKSFFLTRIKKNVNFLQPQIRESYQERKKPDCRGFWKLWVKIKIE